MARCLHFHRINVQITRHIFLCFRLAWTIMRPLMRSHWAAGSINRLTCFSTFSFVCRLPPGLGVRGVILCFPFCSGASCGASAFITAQVLSSQYEVTGNVQQLANAHFKLPSLVHPPLRILSSVLRVAAP